jgi:hypothetical protein
VTDTNDSYPKNNIGRELIPLTIRNQSKQGNLYFYLVGTTEPTNQANHCYYLSDFNGDVTLCTPTDGETSYSLPLTEAETVIQFPRLSAVRIYFSFDKKLNVVVGENGIPSATIGWVKDSNFETIFDWIEPTWEVNATDMTLGINTTQVQMFGIPFSLTASGFNADKQPVTLSDGFKAGTSRHQIIDAFKQAPAPWNKLVVSAPAGDVDYRVISPDTGMQFDDSFPRNQLDDYIKQVWEKYTTETLTASAEGVTLKGQVNDTGNLVFTSDAGAKIAAFPKPDTYTVYTSGPVPTDVSPENAGKAGVIRTALQAGFMRSTLLVNAALPDCDTDGYYKSEPVNQYARTFHQFGIDGKAYAFGFDDVCDQSGVIIVHNPQSIAITLLEF